MYFAEWASVFFVVVLVFFSFFCWASVFLSNVFLMVRLELWGVERKTTEVKRQFHHIISGLRAINRIPPTRITG